MGAFEEAIERGVIKEEQITKEILEGFLGGHGRRFYGIDGSKERILLSRGAEVVVESVKGEGVEVVPFRSGKGTWSVEWR
jgi:dihydroorotase